MWAAWYVETPGLVFEGPDIGASAASAAFSPVRLGPQLHTPDGLPASLPPRLPGPHHSSFPSARPHLTLPE